MSQEYGMTEELGLELFERYEYTKIMPEHEKIEIIRLAISLGEKRAEEIKGRYQGKMPGRILENEGIAIVEEADKSNASSNYVKFAEFHVKQNKVILNSHILDALSGFMDREQIREIILCHELYHYFEITLWGRTGELFKRPVKLFGVIPVKRRILAAEEIAAGAFCKKYLSLEFEPQELEKRYFEATAI